MLRTVGFASLPSSFSVPSNTTVRLQHINLSPSSVLNMHTKSSVVALYILVLFFVTLFGLYSYCMCVNYTINAEKYRFSSWSERGPFACQLSEIAELFGMNLVHLHWIYIYKV